jgi:hypothetical protein
VPGAVYAQTHPRERRLDVAIVDVGRGIKASLSETRQVWSHGDALTQALQRGVTRGREAGMGNGLAGTHEIAARNRGRSHIWTGDAVLRSSRLG